ncbi:MAG: type III PLP-dependent enzyme [Alphaproteobacteria bacterium]|nr:type III PLP-dependent enzyme [Alphaproteobacteria bacterium]MCZ6849923.1 type III PLP-dependent enzyme [Alphaproteobacteria bacterium]
MTEKIKRFLAENRLGTPALVVDLGRVVDNYRRLARLLPGAEIYYAIKANPAPPILEALAGLGAHFDAASIFEIRAALAYGAQPARISFGNTIKKEDDIARAARLGIGLYAFDSAGELEKLARGAPGARVYCRLLMTNDSAGWPTSRKFGCDVEMAWDLLVAARRLGLDPYGVSFHVGSQQTDLEQWDIAIARTKLLFTSLQEAGIELAMVNLGGGLPVAYGGGAEGPPVPTLEFGCRAIADALSRHFGNHLPRVIIEPGRALVGDAGVIEAEVVLISHKGYGDQRRWVYLDIGKFGGLWETMDECIRYSIETDHHGGASGPVVLAGPTCDETDVLYDRAGYELPLDLAVGDRVRILAAGAYTASYCSVGFNGFPPLAEHYI